MKYKSCHLIEHGLSINVDSIQACCLSRAFNKGMLPVVSRYENNKINWDKVFEVKRMQRNIQKVTDLPQCEGCYNLCEADWDDDDYIAYINFDHWSRCNSNCIYCNVQTDKQPQKNNVLKAVKDLIKSGRFRNYGEITFQGGEPTVLKEFDGLLNLFLKAGCKVRIHSSGIIFNRAIRNGIKNGTITVVISPDSASKEVYKRVKRVDKSAKVWDNIKRYAKGLEGENRKLVRVKYIIIPGINDTIEEIRLFLDKIKENDIKYVICDIEYTYANRNICNISPHVYILLDFIRHFCEINGITYDNYDSALYAEKNRNFPKTVNFDDEFINAEIKKYMICEQKKNINYPAV